MTARTGAHQPPASRPRTKSSIEIPPGRGFLSSLGLSLGGPPLAISFKNAKLVLENCPPRELNVNSQSTNPWVSPSYAQLGLDLT